VIDWKPALEYDCPRCGAVAGERCLGARPRRNGEQWRRTSFHLERWLLTGWVPPQMRESTVAFHG
jgi:hypothetical protein